jgi:hypothetical protein
LDVADVERANVCQLRRALYGIGLSSGVTSSHGPVTDRRRSRTAIQREDYMNDDDLTYRVEALERQLDRPRNGLAELRREIEGHADD